MQPFDNREGYVWMNGQFLPWKESQVHVLTHALHYASCVFEGERIYEGHVFKLTEHTERLHQSAKILDFEIPYSVNEIKKATNELIERQKIKNGYVRPIAWRGPETMGVSGQKCHIHTAIAVWDWPTYFTPEARLKGIDVCMAKWNRPDPKTAPTNSKAAGMYMISTLSKHDAENKGCQDALMLDWRGYIAETTGANIFFAKDGKLHTPIPDCFLDGITRRTVIDLAKKNNIEIQERVILPDELNDFDEIFITGTAVEVTPIRKIDKKEYQVGQITQKLMKDYDALVLKKPEERGFD